MKQDITGKRTQIEFGYDSIVVRKFINGILGGRMLDFTGFEGSFILAGHVVITDGNGNYKPMPVKGETYGEMPEGYKYAGVVYRSAKTSEPVSIMYRGVVNRYKVPYIIKPDFDLPYIILSADLDENDPYANYKEVMDVTDLPTGDAARVADLSIGGVINDYGTNKPYVRNILVGDAEVDTNVVLKALNAITLDNVTIAGGKGDSNGKIIYAAKTLNLKNIKANENATLYNAFEGAQRSDADYDGVHKIVAENLDIDCPSLTHNILNVYTPANGAEIIIKNSKFNLTVDKSNILRLANYLNAENVKVTFENCEWNYENSLTQSAWAYAGLVIYQPASTDVALGGDVSKFKTWSFEFKNCKYNGEKVTSNNFGEHNQVIYMYNVGGSGKVEDPVEMVEGITINFD